MANSQINHALQGEGVSAGAGILDPLVAVLDAATASAHDKQASQALGGKGFLKEFLSTAPTPEGNEMGLEEAAKLFLLIDEYVTNMGDWEPGDEPKHDAMATGMLKLMEDPNWNNNTVAALLCLTRETQARAAKTSGPILSDTRYGTDIQFEWSDDDTAILLNASALYTRRKGGVLEQDASHVATIMHPYLKCMLRLKMMAEDQPKPTKAKKARMLSSEQQKAASKSSSPHSIQQKAASKSSSPQAMALHEPKSRGSHPQTVIDCAVEWLRISRGIDSNPQRYYRDLCMMWTSGEFEWARNQPIPSQTQVYYWLKNSRRERPAHVDSKIGNKKQRVAQTQQAMKRLALVLKSRLTDFRAGNMGQLALFKCLDSILLLYMDRSNYMPVLLLAQISKSTNLRMRRSEVYSQVQRIMQGRLMDVDARLVLQQLEGSSSNAAGGQENSQAVKQPSSIQIHVDFSNLAVSLQANALKGCKGDFKDTIVNLGDVLGTERLFYIGEGGFGTVFACPDKRMAIKVFKRPGHLESVVKDLANEASCFHLASTLNRMSSSGSRGVAASRYKLSPFAPLPIVNIAGSTSGAMALPSWGLGGRIYYPALVMELAIGTINSESRELSKSFFSDPMGAVTDEGFVRLAALMRFVAEPLAAMHSLNLAHRDVKEDNILALRVAPGVNGNIYYSTAGKKWTGRLGDCGKALSFDVQFETGPEATA